MRILVFSLGNANVGAEHGATRALRPRADSLLDGDTNSIESTADRLQGALELGYASSPSQEVFMMVDYLYYRTLCS